ncbi:MAG: PhoX family protein [Fimbriimonadaceae bacterium]
MDEKQMHYDSDMVVRSDAGQGLDFGKVVESRIGRRGLIKGGIVAVFAASPLGKAFAAVSQDSVAKVDGLAFEGISPSSGKEITLAKGYSHHLVIGWGDAFDATLVAVDPEKITATAQTRAFGYNNDFVGYLPLPFGSENSDHGLLAVNHEYVNPELMFDIQGDFKKLTKDQIDVCLEAVGFGVVEIKLTDKKWHPVVASQFNKRYSATTKMEFTGPARGDSRLKTSVSKDGISVIGTLANCSAGKTPWGTVLSGEENFQDLFAHAAYTSKTDVRSAERYGIGKGASQYSWERFYDRFDVSKEPNEPYHFGWVVEIDPFDPSWTPKKRTALGRFRHEAATTHVAKSGQVVMYSGDDSRFEYVYKFVSRDRYDAKDRKANRDLMDHGTLYVAKFNDDGSGEWLPLVFGKGPLTQENGFESQGDVVIDARIAADLLGATKMDRPEDIEVNPVNNKVYVVCTNNTDRGKEGKEGPTTMNPRNDNKHGHIVEIVEGGGNDHTATTFEWELFLVCGDPEDESTYYAGYPKEKVSPISSPDNVCFDRFGNMWISTDGQEKTLKTRDGFFAVPTEGPERGSLRQFMASVPGSEVCGPEFTPDGTTAFLAIQHPIEGTLFGKWEESWPEAGKIARPGVIAIRADNGAPIGSPETQTVSRRGLVDELFGK